MSETNFDEGAVCMPNIGIGERRKRMRVAYVGLSAGALLGAFLVLRVDAHAPRLAVFLPFVVGAYGYWQARAKT